MNLVTPQPEVKKPVLVWDGECAFCEYWKNYWHKLTGDAVEYKSYQEVAQNYPIIPLDDFKRGVQYIAPDGKVAKNAEASFLTLSNAPNKGIWLWLYRNVPGFAAISELVYSFISKNRSPLFHVTRFVYGRTYEPPRHDLISWLFLRGLGVLLLAAFVSFAVQAMGLIGSHGILPLTEYMNAAHAQLGEVGFLKIPSIFWWFQNDTAIKTICWAGAGLSLLLVAGVFERISLFLLYVLYMSVTYAGQTFMTFQWDYLLIETTFLGLILCFARGQGIWLLRWLIFRFMLGSGLVKIFSGDSSWQDFTALYYHFETQPLPTPLAWYMHQLPHEVLRFLTFMTLFVELVMPFFIFTPRRLRFVAAFCFLALQSVILVTGNYNFFNLNALLLCLPLFDDQAVQKIIPRKITWRIKNRLKILVPRPKVSIAVGVVVAWLVISSLIQFQMRYGHTIPSILYEANEAMAPFTLVSNYGPFAVMTRTRPELIIEGSDDGVNWKEYEFKYKPGDVQRGTSWNIPHQPRLDWQMWFAALGSVQDNQWVVHLVQRLLENDPDVLALMEDSPFGDKAPIYVRAQLYEYHFATPEERDGAGYYWTRTLKETYFPQARLKSAVDLRN